MRMVHPIGSYRLPKNLRMLPLRHCMCMNSATSFVGSPKDCPEKVGAIGQTAKIGGMLVSRYL